MSAANHQLDHLVMGGLGNLPPTSTPRRNTTLRSATAKMSCRLWLMKITPLPCA
jgi:hypothetical protein